MGPGLPERKSLPPGVGDTQPVAVQTQSFTSNTSLGWVSVEGTFNEATVGPVSSLHFAKHLHCDPGAHFLHLQKVYLPVRIGDGKGKGNTEDDRPPAVPRTVFLVQLSVALPFTLKVSSFER